MDGGEEIQEDLSPREGPTESIQEQSSDQLVRRADDKRLQEGEIDIEVITAQKTLQDVIRTNSTVLESEILFGENDQIYPKEIQPRNNLWNISVLGKFVERSVFFESDQPDLTARRLLEEPYVYISGEPVLQSGRTDSVAVASPKDFTVETPRPVLIRIPRKKDNRRQVGAGQLVTIAKYYADDTFSSSMAVVDGEPPQPVVLLALSSNKPVSGIVADDAERMLGSILRLKRVLFSVSGIFSLESLMRARFRAFQQQTPLKLRYKFENTDLVKILLALFEKLGEPVVSGLEMALMGSAHKSWMKRLYRDLMVYGPTSKEVEFGLAAEVLRRENLSEKVKTLNRATRDKSLSSQLAMFANKLFGKRLPVVSDPEKVLLPLTEQEREAVMTVFTNQKNAILARTLNDCRHVALVMSLRKSPSIEFKNILMMLRPYLPETIPTDSFLTCRQCGYSLMCPHFHKKISLEAMDKPPVDAESQLDVFASKSRRGKTFTVFCKICGETLFRKRNEERDPQFAGRIGSVDPELQKYVWFVAIDLSRYLKFDTYVNNKKFANYAVQDVMPLILLAEELALKKGVKIETTSDNISPRLRLYSIVFVYAYVLNLISSGGVKIAEVNRGKLSDSAAFLVKRINKRFGLEVARISRQSDYALNRFREAYKIVTESLGKQKISNPDPVKITEYNITDVDVIFNYAKAAYLYAGKSKPTLENIVGNIWDDDFPENLYGKLYIPEKYANSRTPSGTTSETVKLGEKNAVDRFLARYASLADYLRGDPNIVMGDIGPKRAIFIEENRTLRAEDVAEVRLAQKCCGVPFHDFHFARVDRELPYVPITALFGEDGHRHVWAYEFKSGKLRRNVWERPINPVCEICGVSKYHNTLDVAKTQKAYSLLTGISTFYQFYDSRCPEGDVHTFGPKHKCTKCGMTNELFEKGRVSDLDKDVVSYYNKYVDKYEKSKWRRPGREDGARASPPKRTEDAKFVDAWEYDYASVKKVASVLGVSVATVESIGNSEGRIDEEEQTTEPTSKGDFRIYLTAGMTRSFISSVMFFRNSSKMSIGRSKKVDEFLAEISTTKKGKPPLQRDSPGAPQAEKITYASLGKKLPDLSDEIKFTQRFSAFLDRREPKDARKFSIDQFAQALLKTWEFSDVGRKLAEKIGGDIIRRNELFHPPDYDKFNLLKYGLKNFSGVNDTSGDFVAPEIGLTGEDVPETEDDTNPFSLENIDYDGHNDEPA